MTKKKIDKWMNLLRLVISAAFALFMTYGVETSIVINGVKLGNLFVLILWFVIAMAISAAFSTERT